MDSNANPYASPADANSPEPGEPLPLEPWQNKRLEVGEVVVAWEKRRLFYNVILAVATLLAAASLRGGDWPDDLVTPVVFLAAAAFGANCCYLAGPLVEGYWTWFFGPSRWLRELLFWGGSVFASVLAWALMFDYLF